MSKISRIVQSLMFDYDSLSVADLERLSKVLSMKLKRWVASNAPDNRIRQFLLQKTNVSIGRDSVVNYGVLILDCYKKLVTIGDRVAIASNVTIICVSDPNNSALKDHPYVKGCLIEEGPVVIKDDAWIGAGAVILPNISIGERAIVGAGAVVVEDVPADTICAGVPCKVIRRLRNGCGAKHRKAAGTKM